MRKSSGSRKGVNVTHGFFGKPEYKSWDGMKSRCTNPKSTGYQNYGGRGIKVCDRWSISFENFLEDMGLMPGPAFTLDRIDVNDDYKPENCRWLSKKDQSRNTRRTLFIEHEGERMSAVEWSERLGINYYTIKARIRYGWSIERVLTERVR